MINCIYQLTNPKTITIKHENLVIDNEIIIKPLFMALCHADQRYYTGKREKKVLEKKLPMALIHECCGEVVYDKLGIYNIGQKVVLIPNIPPSKDELIYENYRAGSKFLSSGYDGFMREYINMPRDRIIPFENIPLDIASITEFVSVCEHAFERFNTSSNLNKKKIAIWGDGSLSFVMANILKKELPETQIYVVGKNPEKLSIFSFADKVFLLDELTEDFKVDHCFECVGGSGSENAINDAIRYIKPQGTIVLMGVSENRISINTRDILEKGITLVGSSRSGYNDFHNAIEHMKDITFQKRLRNIIEYYGDVKNIEDIHDVFKNDLNSAFKTVFKWKL